MKKFIVRWALKVLKDEIMQRGSEMTYHELHQWGVEDFCEDETDEISITL